MEKGKDIDRMDLALLGVVVLELVTEDLERIMQTKSMEA
jgi:hypothetical protein